MQRNSPHGSEPDTWPVEKVVWFDLESYPLDALCEEAIQLVVGVDPLGRPA